MATKITFYPVGNGDMTLISLGDSAAGTNILVDCNIRAAADDPEDLTRDVAADLRKRLKTDKRGRPYVDVFLSTHPDRDHLTGLKKHFHLGALADYGDDGKPANEKRIVIREMWSSPIVFRRRERMDHTLCDEAVAFNKEAKRRVECARKQKFTGIGDGDRILVLGEDEDGKTDDLTSILVKVDQTFSKINGTENALFNARLLAPFPAADEDEAEAMGKNHSSVILNMELADAPARETVKNYLTAGDAEVLIWEKLWEKHKYKPGVLAYDILLSPHHCSWHSLSYDSRSEKGDKATVCEPAKSALSQISVGGRIIASSSAIKDDDFDPPSHAAKQEYESIVNKKKGEFLCVGEFPTEAEPAPLEFVIRDGSILRSVQKAASPQRSIVTSGIIDAVNSRTARNEAVQKGGNTRYA
jgi:hypothetical protein